MAKKDNKAVRVSSIGGQALMEGVMMRSANSMAMAVVDPAGHTVVETKRFKNGNSVIKKIPILRGIVAFVSSLISGVTTLTRSTEVCSPEEELPSKGWMYFAVLIGLALGVGLFMVVPSLINSLIIDVYFPSNVFVSSLVEGIIRIVIFVLYLLLVSRVKDIKRTFMYHGAEHRTINCYEKGLELTVENVQSCSTRHNRCGTTFLFFVMIVSILVFSITNYLISFLGINAETYGTMLNTLIKLAIRLAMLPLVAGLSYELLKLLAVLPDNFIVAIFRAPGLALQGLTTYPPTDEMTAVAIKSFVAVQELDADPNKKEKRFFEYSIAETKEIIKARLSAIEYENAEIDWILCDALNCKRSEISSVEQIGESEYKKLSAIINRRITGEPLWYILGHTEFYGHKVIVNSNVLIPRMETEILAERVINFAKENNSASVLDLCTGSGAIALAVAKDTSCKVTAIDKSEKALSVASLNLEGTSAKVINSDMFSELTGTSYDIIVSNPPYIRTADIDSLQVEVKCYEPMMALDGGESGLDFYKIIADSSANYLNENGALFLEVGFDQAEEVAKLLEISFKNIEIIKDLEGVPRIVKAIKK